MPAFDYPVSPFGHLLTRALFLSFFVSAALSSCGGTSRTPRLPEKIDYRSSERVHKASLLGSMVRPARRMHKGVHEFLNRLALSNHAAAHRSFRGRRCLLSLSVGNDSSSSWSPCVLIYFYFTYSHVSRVHVCVLWRLRAGTDASRKNAAERCM